MGISSISLHLLQLFVTLCLPADFFIDQKSYWNLLRWVWIPYRQIPIWVELLLVTDQKSIFSSTNFIQFNLMWNELLSSGKVESGVVSIGDKIKVLSLDGTPLVNEAKVTKLFYLEGLQRVDVERAYAGLLRDFIVNFILLAYIIISYNFAGWLVWKLFDFLFCRWNSFSSWLRSRCIGDCVQLGSFRTGEDNPHFTSCHFHVLRSQWLASAR